MNFEMKKLQREIGEWGAKTFPRADKYASAHGIANHLAEEADEILDEVIGIHEGFDRRAELRMEVADAGILLFQLAHTLGFDLETAIREKMEINKQRTWGKPDHRGVVKHVKT